MGLVCLLCLHADLPTPRALPPSLPPSPFVAEYGLLALQLRAEASAKGTAVMCLVLATQVSLLRMMDGGLRLLDPFHSLFLPLGLSPAFLSPITAGDCVPCQEPLESMCRPRLCLAAHLLFSPCWLPPPLLLQCQGSPPTWGFTTHLAFCLHSPSIHSVSLTPTCASVSLGLILCQPLPWVPATPTSALQSGFPC